MNRFQGEINDHILHKKMPNFQMCSTDKKESSKGRLAISWLKKGKVIYRYVGEIISSSDRNLWNFCVFKHTVNCAKKYSKFRF